jgi:hypothetical protein
MGGFVYCLLGSTSHVTIGPVSILALMTGRRQLTFVFIKNHRIDGFHPQSEPNCNGISLVDLLNF